MTTDLLGDPVPEPRKRQAAPTIKTDRRQVEMFGMRDAAIQAQAARDAAGPRTGQCAADHGLFAAPAASEQEPML